MTYMTLNYLKLQLIDLQQAVYSFNIETSKNPMGGDFLSFTIRITTSVWLSGKSGLYLYIWREGRQKNNYTILYRVKVENPIVRKTESNSANYSIQLNIREGGRNICIADVVTVEYFRNEFLKRGVDVCCAVFLDTFGDGDAIVPYYKELAEYLKGSGQYLPNILPIIDGKYLKKL